MIENFLKSLELKGWKQKEIADKTGLSKSHICGLSKGLSCSAESLIKIADAFGVSTDTVLGRSAGKALTPAEELLLQTTDGNDKVTRAALRSAQGEKSLLNLEGEGEKGNFRKAG
jgi:transcriptional regulator with XRE-family HTH domain